MPNFALRLGLALTQGTALAVLSTAGCDATTAEPGSPYPEAALGCTDDPPSPHSGRCCAKAYCYTPSDGACAEPDDAPSALGLSFGSGSCLCTQTPIAGPYAPNPTNTPESAGSCCYVISSMGCDGRPLVVDGRVLTSELELRADWIERDLLELLSA